jgi:hypothetical protein
MTTWRLFFLDGDIKAEMISLPWNNFLWSILRLVVVRFGRDERLERISFRSVFLILRWQRKEKRKTQERRSFLTTPVGTLVVIRWASILRPFAECLPVRSSIRSVVHVWFEIWSYWQRECNLNENQFLDICSVFQSAC